MTALPVSDAVLSPLDELRGTHPLMGELRDAIRRAAVSKAPVVFWGPTGAGKEVAARVLHKLRHQTSCGFCPVNLAAIPEALVEGELFGVKRGAYTGATVDRAGLIESAANGTLFLDEAGDLPASVQTKLLRVLELGEVRRVGATRGTTVQFRLIAATQEEPQMLRQWGRWREDLYYRMAGVVLRVPALREHREDIPLLISMFCRDHGLMTPDAEGVDLLVQQQWPGNIRELQHTLLRAAFLADHGGVTRDHVLSALRDLGPRITVGDPRRLCTLLEAQQAHVQDVVRACAGDTAKAAEILGVSRRHLYRYLRPLTPASTRH